MTDLSGSRVAPQRVQLLATCLVDALRPDVGWAVVGLLERLGVAVSLPAGQTCCGQPALNAGCRADAREMARHTLRLLSRSEDPVVVPSGSCADMIRHRYAEILEGEERERARRLAARTFELSELLTGPLAARDPGARCPTRIAYHPSCHLLRGLGVQGGPERLIDGVAGARRVELEGSQECCGFGGLFAIKHSEISSAMLRRKLDALEASGAERVVACDLSCLVHLEGGLRRRGSSIAVQHLAELLEER
jgi:L-lactate dehydrogenase complex protein LldE